MKSRSLDKAISTLEMEVSSRSGERGANDSSSSTSSRRSQAFVVIGINTAFSSKKRRESVRKTWVLGGEQLRKVEKEKGVVIRFVIGHSATPGGGVLDRAI